MKKMRRSDYGCNLAKTGIQTVIGGGGLSGYGDGWHGVPRRCRFICPLDGVPVVFGDVPADS